MPRRKPRAEHLHWPVLVTAAVALAAVGGLVVWYEKVGADRKAAPPGTTFQAARTAGATVSPSEPAPKIDVPRPVPAPERH